MSRRWHITIIVMALLALAGCAASPSKYDWGSYNDSLYAYYKDPTKASELIVSLQAIIDGVKAGHGAVPPGVFAEYGYLKLQQGKAPEAVASFRQEEQLWPESKVFMDRMIQVASSERTAPVAKEP